jgi:hypothetical protein
MSKEEEGYKNPKPCKSNGNKLADPMQEVSTAI